MAKGPVDIDLSGPERRLKNLARAMRSEEDGKTLRRELTKGIRSAAGPARQAARAGIRSMSSKGHKGAKLRSAISQKIVIVAKPSGKEVGVRIVAKKPSLRGFENAPAYTDSSGGWRHPVYGHRTRWVSQRGKPKWFENSIKNVKPKIKQEIKKAMGEAASRIARRVQL